MSEEQDFQARIRATERREIVLALAWQNAKSAMSDEWHEGLDSAISIAADPDSLARSKAVSDE